MFLTIMGMYEYDNSLFDGLDCPTYTDKNNVVHVVNKTDVINSILLNCGELEVLYPNFAIMKMAIGVWSASEFDTWQKLYETQKAEYNPLWNVDADVVNIGSVMGFNESTQWSDAAKETQRRTGNIGITSSQELIRQQRDIADFSIIRFMTESFKKRFCLMVY